MHVEAEPTATSTETSRAALRRIAAVTSAAAVWKAVIPARVSSTNTLGNSAFKGNATNLNTGATKHVSGDTYSAEQVGAMGPGAHAQDMTFQQIKTIGGPPSADVNIHEVMHQISDLLSRLNAPEQKKIDNALDEAKGDLEKAEPGRDEFRQGLERALKYAKNASTFATIADELRPLVSQVAKWGGTGWQALLGLLNQSS